MHGGTNAKLPNHAKNDSNQRALDRLIERYENASSRHNTNYSLVIRRAIKSLANCETEVSTIKEAMALKYVGATLAKVICPVVTPTEEPLPLSSHGVTKSQRATGRSKSKSGKSHATKLEDGKPSAKQVAYKKAVAEAESLVLPTNNWKVLLLVDGREHRSDHVQAKLHMSGVPCEQRHLPIGDMAWIARSGKVEVMLGTIVERKEVHDLASSLYGTRYLEQRLRLQHCGLPQPLLLVEGNVDSVANCPADTIQMAMMETRIQLNFQVVQTDDLHHTVKFLKSVHRRILQRSFPSAFGAGKENSLPTFASPNARRRDRIRKVRRSLDQMEFDTAPTPPFGTNRFITYQELKCKVEKDREEGTRTVHAIHCAMLKQISSFSQKKVLAVARVYPTPHSLMMALDGLDENEGKELFESLETCTGPTERTCRVGPKSATELCHVYQCRGKKRIEDATDNNNDDDSGLKQSGFATDGQSSSAAEHDESAGLSASQNVEIDDKVIVRDAGEPPSPLDASRTYKTIGTKRSAGLAHEIVELCGSNDDQSSCGLPPSDSALPRAMARSDCATNDSSDSDLELAQRLDKRKKARSVPNSAVRIEIMCSSDDESTVQGVLAPFSQASEVIEID